MKNLIILDCIIGDAYVFPITKEEERNIDEFALSKGYDLDNYDWMIARNINYE